MLTTALRSPRQRWPTWGPGGPSATRGNITAPSSPNEPSSAPAASFVGSAHSRRKIATLPSWIARTSTAATAPPPYGGATSWPFKGIRVRCSSRGSPPDRERLRWEPAGRGWADPLRGFARPPGRGAEGGGRRAPPSPVQGPQVDLDGGHLAPGNHPLHAAGELGRGELLAPNPHGVSSRWNGRELEPPLAIGQHEGSSVKDEDVGEHLRMDVAELAIDPRAAEGVSPGLPLLPGAEVVALAVGGEDVVLERIAVPEFHRGSHSHREDMGAEAPLALVHHRALAGGPGGLSGDPRDEDHDRIPLRLPRNHPPDDPSGLEPGTDGREDEDETEQSEQPPHRLSPRPEQAPVERVTDELCAAPEVQLFLDAFPVGLHGLHADVHPL